MKFIIKSTNSDLIKRNVYTLFKRYLFNSKNSEFSTQLMTGIQPTGCLHIGNYFGAIKQTVELQNSGRFKKLFISIVDLHTLSEPQTPSVLKERIFNLACSLLACGLDSDQTVLFQQSSVPQHAELSWILGCLTSLNKLDHLPQWKEKNVGNKKTLLGLYSYPVLQAADILLYKATHVPVGEDQLKHLELARHLAKSFNRTYQTIFPLPIAISDEKIKIKSLRDPFKKMSKSEKDERGRIELSDTPEQIREKLRKAVTDSGGKDERISYDPDGRPGVSNIIDIYASFCKLTPHQICQQNANMNTLELKEKTAESIIEALKPIRTSMMRLKKEPQYVIDVLNKGKDNASEIARNNMKQVKQSIGLL